LCHAPYRGSSTFRSVAGEGLAELAGARGLSNILAADTEAWLDKPCPPPRSPDPLRLPSSNLRATWPA